MTAVSLTSDCARCAALCCVGLAFDRSPLFAFDKAAGEPCRHLRPNARCGIHAELTQSGFKGCAQYDCGGAGQRVTQELFAGASWQEDPALLAPMTRAFALMTRIHAQLALLDSARRLPLDDAERAALDALEAELRRERPWTVDELETAPLGEIVRRCSAFLTSLRHLTWRIDSAASVRQVRAP